MCLETKYIKAKRYSVAPFFTRIFDLSGKVNTKLKGQANLVKEVPAPEEKCSYCGTINNSHHSANCIDTKKGTIPNPNSLPYTPKPLEIQQGKLYRLRDGRKAFIQYTDHELAIGCLEKSFTHYYWKLNGKSSADNVPHTDIISEWKD